MNEPAGERRTGLRNPRSLLLAEASALVLIAFCYLPPERMWFDHLLEYCGEVGDQLQDCSLEHRMRSVLGANYILPVEIAGQLRSNDVLLLPPVEYVRAHLGGDACVWVEPKWFYYMAGRVRTVTARSPRVREATCTVLVDPQGRCRLSRFGSSDDLDRALQAFVQPRP